MKLITLCTLMDREGLLLVMTRINERDDNQDFRYLVVLPSNHELVKGWLETSICNLHMRGYGMLNDLRQQFWILRGRKTVQGMIAKCIQC